MQCYLMCYQLILHFEIGVGNKLLSTFLDWIDMRIEQIEEGAGQGDV
jgi:hypothetical protein